MTGDPVVGGTRRPVPCIEPVRPSWPDGHPQMDVAVGTSELPQRVTGAEPTPPTSNSAPPPRRTAILTALPVQMWVVGADLHGERLVGGRGLPGVEDWWLGGCDLGVWCGAPRVSRAGPAVGKRGPPAPTLAGTRRAARACTGSIRAPRPPGLPLRRRTGVVPTEPTRRLFRGGGGVGSAGGWVTRTGPHPGSC